MFFIEARIASSWRRLLLHGQLFLFIIVGLLNDSLGRVCSLSPLLEQLQRWEAKSLS